MAEVDVIVLGGGPAGTAAAIQCACQGMRTVLIERSSFPRSLPGETLHPGTLVLLRQLGVEQDVLNAGYLRHAGYFLRENGREKFIEYGKDANGPWFALQAWRASFDAILLSRCREIGVNVLQPIICREPVVEQGRVTGVVTETGMHRSRYVIDATGRRSWLGRALGIRTQGTGPRRIAWYGYARGKGPLRDDVPAFRMDSDGWVWTAKIRDNLYHWTRLSLDNIRPNDHWMPEEFDGLCPCEIPRGVDVTWRFANRPAGAGYFLVGDASCILDPASSHGVLRALMSGMMAAYLAAQVVSGTTSDGVAQHHYTTWLSEWYHRDTAQLTHFYNQMRLSSPVTEPVL